MRRKRTNPMVVENRFEMQADASTSSYGRRARPFNSSHGRSSVRSSRRTAARVKSCSAVDGHGTATQRIPAATAADNPLNESSTITSASGRTSSRRAASRKMSGAGFPRLDLVPGHDELEEARQPEAIQRGGDDRRRRRRRQREADSRAAERVQHVRHAAHRCQGPAQQLHGARHPRGRQLALVRLEAVARAQRVEHVTVGAPEEVLVEVRNVVDPEIRQQRARGLEVNRLRVDQDAVHVEDHRVDLLRRACRLFPLHGPLPTVFLGLPASIFWIPDSGSSECWLLSSDRIVPITERGPHHQLEGRAVAPHALLHAIRPQVPVVHPPGRAAGAMARPAPTDRRWPGCRAAGPARSLARSRPSRRAASSPSTETSSASSALYRAPGGPWRHTSQPMKLASSSPA